jgi:tetratricopeptide (TPR) repeat protein/predicted Ser/Thr protein kinase
LYDSNDAPPPSADTTDTEVLTDSPSPDTDVERVAPPLVLERGTAVGRYVVLEPLGQGGMGVVYRAYDPELDRNVALKVISPRRGGDGAHESRLGREAQALARLNHENVVAVHDVGSYAGRIFVAMELVDGQTLAGWLKEAPRSQREILKVFRAAGRGLSAAHAAGLIHRDFKPTNVMIGRDGRVRVLDFGLARAAGEGEGERTSLTPGERASTPLLSSPLTQAGVLVGTPHYMAPEQLRKGGGSARSDQYCFCLTLWEALCGKRPFSAVDVKALLARLESGEPDPPPAERKLPAWLRRLLLRGLSPEPAQRFASMDELLAELDKDPARRLRRLAMLAAVAIVAGAAVAVVMSMVRTQGARASRCAAADAPLAALWSEPQRRQLREAFARRGGPYGAEAAARVERIFDGYVASWASTSRDACEATWVRGAQSEALLDRRSACLERRRSGLGALLERFLAADVDTLTDAVPAALALPAVSDCSDLEALAAQAAAPSDPDKLREIRAARAVLARAEAFNLAGQSGAALAALESWIGRIRRLGWQPLELELLELLARARAEEPGQLGVAESTTDEAMRLAASSGDDRALARLWVLQIGLLGNDLGRPQEALGMRRPAELALLRAAVPERDRTRGDLGHNLALAAWRAGRNEEALALCSESLSLRERTLGADHHLVGSSLNLLAILQTEKNDLEAAARTHERALAVRRAALGDNHPFVADSLDNLGVIRQSQGRASEALALHERARVLRERVLGAEHPDLATSLNNVASLRLDLGEHEEAEQLFLRVKAIWERTLPATDPSLAIVLGNLGEVALARGDAAAARAACQRALDIEAPTIEADDPNLAWQYNCLGEAALLAGDARAALPLVERALGLRKDAAPLEKARSELSVARALVAGRVDRPRALTLARSARESFAAGGALGALRLREAERLLATLSGRPLRHAAASRDAPRTGQGQ